jgi:predicted Zn finger-like uncharacterized protein
VNVTCDKCGKRYVISDDKVAGKASVKIRCKQCQNLISVAVTAGGGVAAPARSPWEDESTRAMPPLDTTAQWFAMLGGKQEGPFDLVELQRRVGGGEVTLRTYLWKAGMGDWKRASDVPEVSPIFAGVPAPPAAPPKMPKDVAVSNEVPAPGVSNKASAQSGAGAVVTNSQPLNDLFGDVSGLHDQPPARQEPSPGELSASALESSPPIDPFAALSEGDGKEAPPPGEATRFFIAQAGVNKRNPPWKIALFVLAFVGGPLALIYVLNTFEIVKMPTVTRTDENGQEVQESFFSADGVAGLKDMLTGEEKKRKAAADKAKAERDAAALAARTAKNPKGGTTAEPEPEVVKPKVQDPNLAAFYGEDERKTTVPKVRKTDEDTAPAAVNTSGLSADAIAKVVADKSKAFQTCIDNALRRNPNLAVGNVTVILNVGPSGAVKSAGIDPKKHETTEWGQCMMSTGKRIVFPGSDAETEVQLPFKVGVAVN